MLTIRLQRVGRTNDPHFRVVVIDSKRAAKSGSFTELIRAYNPKSGDLTLKEERIKHWLSVGAKPSQTMHNFLVDKKLVTGPKIHVSRTKSKKEEKQETSPAALIKQVAPAA